jgi:hypothetical protein
MMDKMINIKEFRRLFTTCEELLIGRSRRYDILSGRNVIDGFNAVIFFKSIGVDYRTFTRFVNHGAYQFSRHNRKLYNFSMSKFLMSINIDKFISYNNISRETFFKIIDTDSRSAKIILGRGDSLPLDICLKMETIFGVPLPMWFSKLLDIKTISSNWHAGKRKKMYLPKYLEVGEGSKVRTFESAISFIRKHFGQSIVFDILRRMQLDSDIFRYPDKDISINAFTMLAEIMRSYGCDDSFFKEMGEHNPYSNIISKIDFRQRFNPQSTFDVLKNLSNHLIPRIDRNYDYEIKVIRSNHIQITTKPKFEMIEKMNTQKLGSRDVALYQFGHIGSISIYFDLPPAIDASNMIYNEDNDVTIFNYFF